MGVHELARPLELHCEFRALPQHRPDPFLVDRIRPSRPEKLRHGQAHQQIAQWRRVEHAGVEEGREHRHASDRPSVPEAEFLRLLNQFIERPMAGVMLPVLAPSRNVPSVQD